MQASWYFPHDNQQLMHFYFVICSAYMLIHLVLDWRSEKTPPFSFSNMKYKLHQVFSGITLASSAFFIVIIVDLSNPLRYSDALIVPLTYAALSGILISLSDIVPDADEQGEIKR
ncbi:hypothetical protein ACFL9S_07935 [Erwinia sp. AnSW2-5]|uniref:hypothetical protein n=1 Tax=Erwinia sp. AnSW2-5 TaxID=3367692 RepID=UPI00385BE71C